MIDGISGIDLASVLFDLSPIPNRLEAEPWTPQPEPRLRSSLPPESGDCSNVPSSSPARPSTPLSTRGKRCRGLASPPGGLGEIVWAALNPAPDTPLNVDIGPYRRLAGISSSLASFKVIKTALGGTVNDAVLTVVAGGLNRWLRSRPEYRGTRVEGARAGIDQSGDRAR